ncbi:MAG: ADP-glyceromanno-heptose 6-epimerase [Zetaproteobacteria bacterium]|nr:MAG: ADP-glyceromanno-heptose 6-epimerase [Zetaproteobacteria bacterium]
MSERILVTGGAGFIGANLAKALVQRPGTEVVVIDDFSSGDWHNLIDIDCELRAVDCADSRLLEEIADGAFTAIFHQAAITDTTVLDQRRMIEVNTNAFAALLAASARAGTRVVYASSAGVYGNSPAPNRVGYGEIPENVYGFSKLAMDRVAARWYERHPAPIIGMRYFNVYGPGERHKQCKDGNKTSSMMLQLYEQVREGRRPRLFKYGEQKRDFVYIRDVVDANLAALEAPRSGVCNIGTGRARTFNEVVSNLGRVLGVELDIEYFDNPYPFYQNHTEADLSETEQLLAWRPAWSLEDGMADYLRHLTQGEDRPIGGSA